MKYAIATPATLPVMREPTPGRWYAGITANGETGALAKWDGWKFSSSVCDDHDMAQYPALLEMPERA